MSTVPEVTDDNFEAEVLGSDVPVLVDFWATWCPPCQQMAPVIDELESELVGKAKVVKLDVDKNPDIAGRYGIRSIPTFNVYKDGELVESTAGSQPKATLAKIIAKHS